MTDLSHAEIWAIKTALRIAARQYENDARDLDAFGPSHESFAQGFRTQAKIIIGIADKFEGASKVSIQD